jgi:hypothetical protein
MTKKIVTILIAALFLFGCNGINSKKEPQEYEYRTGTQGLELSFTQGFLTKLYENDRGISFTIEARNRGAFPQLDELDEFYGNIWLGGFSRDLIRVRPDNILLIEQEVEGRSAYNQDGGYTIEEFEVDVYELPSGSTYFKPTFIATTTYFYKTIASPVVCIDPSPRSTQVRAKVCTVHDVSPGSQGAPIAITKIEEDITGESILFKIQVENSGGGIVIPDYLIDQNPHEGYDYRDLDEVRIDEIKLGNVRMSSCRPDTYLQLINDQGTIFCRLDKSNIPNEVFTSPLNIELSYGYMSSISKDVEIFEEVAY